MTKRARKKTGLAAAATAPKPNPVALKGTTMLHNAVEGRVTTPANENENERGLVLLEIRKGGREVVRVSISTFKGSTFLDVRTWAEKADGLIPTAKGATIPLERAWELREALRQAELPIPPDVARRAS
jgi:hypothetical protein